MSMKATWMYEYFKSWIKLIFLFFLFNFLAKSLILFENYEANINSFSFSLLHLLMH